MPTRIASLAARCSCTRWRDAVAGDPLAAAVGCGGAPVERRRPLDRDPGAAARDRGQPDRAGTPPPRRRARPRCTSTPPARRARRRRATLARVGDARRRRARLRRRCRATVHGPVRPVWLQGSRVTTAVRPRIRTPSGRGSFDEGVDLGVRGAGAVVPALGEDRRRPASSENAADLRVAAGDGPSAASSRARAHERLVPSRVASLPVIRSPSSRRPGMRESALAPPHREHVQKRVLPPIRTLTVGPGIPPDRLPRSHRAEEFADYHRRLGFSPTPEHVLLVSHTTTQGSRGYSPLRRAVTQRNSGESRRFDRHWLNRRTPPELAGFDGLVPPCPPRRDPELRDPQMSLARPWWVGTLRP